MKRRNELTNDYIQGAVEEVAASASSEMEMPQLMVNDDFFDFQDFIG